MAKSLREIAEQLRGNKKKVALIYAFNGTGKTLLSREFKQLVAPKVEIDESEQEQQSELSRKKILYYNAFTEDLFYWDNDLEEDAAPKLKIQPNSFTNWILKERGQDQNITTNFQRYTDSKLTPRFNEEYRIPGDNEKKEIKVPAFSEVTFSRKRGDDTNQENIKISKGEESNFIWSMFYTLLNEVIAARNIEGTDARDSNQFDQLEYIFIDDPVSSLDENHLIQLAVDLASLISSSNSSNLQFMITTHNPLFYNVLYNELGTKISYLLERYDDGKFDLHEKLGDSNQSFSYHLYLKQTLEKAIADNKIEKFHFTLLRNLYEKTANFLGYPKWSELLPDNKEAYSRRIIQFSSHSTLSNEAVAEPTQQEKQMIVFLLKHLLDNFSYWPKKEASNVRTN